MGYRTTQVLHSIKGTPLYMAPELVQARTAVQSLVALTAILGVAVTGDRRSLRSTYKPHDHRLRVKASELLLSGASRLGVAWQEHPYDQTVDLWSLGVILYELYVGQVLPVSTPSRTKRSRCASLSVRACL